MYPADLPRRAPRRRRPGAAPARRVAGFSLIELAVVLLILGLLLGALLRPLRGQVETQQYQEAERMLDDIRDAVIGFALANGRLPCPADPTAPTDVAGAGSEARSAGACTIATGAVAWRTLGVPELDPWGRRFTYRVTTSFADDPPVGGYSSFALSSTGNIQVRNAAATVDVALNLPVIFLSHGKNGLRAYRPDGTMIASPAASGAELENGNGDVNFAVEPQGDAFDDVLRWIPGDLLKNRMVTAGRLP